MTIADDEHTTVLALRQRVAHFVRERDWEQFHLPKNLAMALAIEAAELMEHFQWLTPEQSQALPRDQAKLAAVGEELADVLCYVLALANALDVDLTALFRQKMRKNEEKYPAEEFRGRYGPEAP